jgi:hypothetical protein
LCRTPRWHSYRDLHLALRLALLPVRRLAAPGWAALLPVHRRGASGSAARLVKPDLLPAARLVAVVHRLCHARPGRPAELGLPARLVMPLREVIIATLVLQGMAPHAAIRAMAMTGDTDAGQDMPQLMALAPPPDMATATPSIAMTATAVTELTAPGVTGTSRCAINEADAARRTPFSAAERQYSACVLYCRRVPETVGISLRHQRPLYSNVPSLSVPSLGLFCGGYACPQKRGPPWVFVR